jgi:cytochrome c553
MKKVIIAAVMAALVAGFYNVNAADAKTNYKKVGCAGCHGDDGKGQTKLGVKFGAKDYTDPKVQDAVKDEQMFKSIKEGLKKDGKVIMAAIGDKLTDAEIKEIVAYIRAFKKK